MSVVRQWGRLPREVVGALCLPVLKGHWDSALSNALELLVSPGVVRQLDQMICESPFQQNY